MIAYSPHFNTWSYRSGHNGGALKASVAFAPWVRILHSTPYPGIAQLVERQFWELEAVSSRLTTRTSGAVTPHMPYSADSIRCRDRDGKSYGSDCGIWAAPPHKKDRFYKGGINISQLQSEIPLWKKVTLSFEEASLYTGIGQNKLRALCSNNPSLMLRNGAHSRIKRTALERYIEEHNEI